MERYADNSQDDLNPLERDFQSRGIRDKMVYKQQ